MKKINAHLLAFGLLWASLTVMAQSQPVSGTVVSDADGNAIPGATIVVKGSNRATSADIEGNFTLNAASGETFVVSFVGFRQKEVAVGASPMMIRLADATFLQEQVVTAQNISREKRQLGYSSQSVKGDELANVARDNVFESLQGRISGLNVTSTSGAPGASSSIQLRQPTSFSGSNQPLIVVDGLILNNNTTNQHNLVSNGDNRNNDYTNRAADINPQDVQSVTVLKGAEGAALYGPDAVNGVIMITTKKGNKGSRVSYNMTYGTTELTRFPAVQKVYDRGNLGVTDPARWVFLGQKYPAGTTFFDNNANYFQSGERQSHDLSFENGTEKTSFRLNANYLKSSGVIPNTTLDRVSLKIGGSAQVSDRLRVESSLSYSNSKNLKSSKGTSGVMLGLLTWPANLDIRDYKNLDGTPKRPATTSAELIDNPLFDKEYNRNQDVVNRTFGSVSLKYEAAKWLDLGSTIGADFAAVDGMRAYHPLSVLFLTSRGQIEQYSDQTRFVNGNGWARFHKDIAKNLNLSVRVGGSFDDRKQSIQSFLGQRFYNFDFYAINNTDATTQRSSSYLEQLRRLAYYGDVTLDYHRFLTLQLTSRTDFTSTLPQDRNKVSTSGANISFVFSELLKKDWLSHGKLRFAVANAPRDFVPYSLYSRLAPQLTTGGGYALGFNGTNNKLEYEVLTSQNLGMEVGFFNGRVDLDISYFKQRNSNQLLRNVRTSYGTGYILNNYNGGICEVQGVEATLIVKPIKTKDFEWTTNINFTQGTSKVVELRSDIKEYYNADSWIFGNVRASVIQGQSLTSFGGYKYQRNTKGDILIDPSNGYPLVDANFTPLGDRNPDFAVGLSNRFAYKGLSLQFTLDMRKGGDVFNGNELYLFQRGLSLRTLNRETPLVFNGVLKDGNEETNPVRNTIQKTPLYQGTTYYNLGTVGFANEDFIEKGINWVRLKDIRLSYVVPAAYMKAAPMIKAVSMFASATDVWMWTNYSGMDPNVNGLNPGSFGSGGAGFDYGVLPTPRGFNVGLNVTF
jgi:TonB-linked SusC/RagA family outer membrane protein